MADDAADAVVQERAHQNRKQPTWHMGWGPRSREHCEFRMQSPGSANAFDDGGTAFVMALSQASESFVDNGHAARISATVLVECAEKQAYCGATAATSASVQPLYSASHTEEAPPPAAPPPPDPDAPPLPAAAPDSASTFAMTTAAPWSMVAQL